MTGSTTGQTPNHAQNVRDALDQIDETPFGKLGKLLDRMADDAQRAVNERNHLLETLKHVRLWLAVEGCEEPLELVDSALLSAGITDAACPVCEGNGEWDEGPLPAKSSAQIDPDYRHVKCPDCDATGRVALAATGGGS
jgi:hypothetical protein